MTDFDLLSYEVEAEWGRPYRIARLEYVGEAPGEDDGIQINQAKYDSGWRIRIFSGRVLSKEFRGSPPNDLRITVTAVSSGWYLTQQYVNESTAMVIPGETPNPKSYIKEWLGGSHWRSITGCEPVWVSEVPNWRSEFAYNRLLFSPARTTKWEAITQICDKFNMVAFTTPHEAFDWDEFRFYEAEYAHKYIFNDVTTINANEDVLSIELRGYYGKEMRYNKVKIFSSDSNWDYFWASAESHMVTWRQWRPREFNYELPDLENPYNASIWADSLLDRFQGATGQVRLVLRSFSEREGGHLLRPGDIIKVENAFDEVNTTWRIYKIIHRAQAGEEAQTEIYAAKFDDLSHPYVETENPFRRLGEEVQQRIMQAARRASPGVFSKQEVVFSSLGERMAGSPCEIIAANPDGTVDIRIINTSQILRRVRIL